MICAWIGLTFCHDYPPTRCVLSIPQKSVIYIYIYIYISENRQGLLTVVPKSYILCAHLRKVLRFAEHQAFCDTSRPCVAGLQGCSPRLAEGGDSSTNYTKWKTDLGWDKNLVLNIWNIVNWSLWYNYFGVWAIYF